MSDLHYIEETLISTNDLVFEKFEHIDSICGIYTFNQKNGRGQYGNIWESSLQENIAISISVPTIDWDMHSSSINFHTAIILRNFVANLTQLQTYIKWPNDIILSNKKISGILIEKKRNKYIIGIGLNVMQKNFDMFPNASSLHSLTSKNYNLHDLSNQLFITLERGLNTNLKKNNILENYNQFLFKKGIVGVYKIKNQLYNGVIKYVDEEGFLWVDIENMGVTKFLNKEIQMLY